MGSSVNTEKNNLLKYVWPSLLASLGSIVVGLTDSALISYYSTNALASVSLGASFYELPVNCILGALMAYRILAPRVNSDTIRETIGIKLFLKIFVPLSLFISLVGIVSSILLSKNISDSIWSAALLYFAARIPSIVAETISTLIVIQLVSWGKTKVPIIVFCIAAPFNVIIDFFLIYGLFFAPELGVVGAGLGSTLASFIPLVYLYLVFNKEKNKFNETSENVEINYKGWGKISLPSLGSAFVDYGGNIIFTALISAAGIVELAGMRFAVQLHIVIFIIISSFSSGILFILGSKYKEEAQGEDFIFIKKYIDRVFVRVSAFTLVLFIIFCVFFGRFISPDEDVVYAFYKLAIFLTFIIPFACVAYSNITLQRFYGFTIDDFKSNSLAVWVIQIPIALLLLNIFSGIWPFAGLLGYWMFRAMWSRKQVRTRFIKAQAN
ncbi:MATE family efflux transporter [Rothia sp. CCM 9418]|uniref:MATE family efflux transporter n=1 Tax=Rothia sp. CCM 9418 TaxID=3402661 RepID=UPI003AE4810B